MTAFTPDAARALGGPEWLVSRRVAAAERLAEITWPTPSEEIWRYSKIGEEQLFYLMSRGLTEEEASAMVVSGFIEPITKELPLEYAVEMNRLIQLQMEGSVG